jgi:hypothetical protein
MRSPLLILAGMALLAAAAGAQASQLVVVSDSQAVGFARGALIEEGTPVKIPDGQKLSLIDESGRGLTLRGPFEGAIRASSGGGGGNDAVLQAVKAILVPVQTAALGAVRDGGTVERPPDARMVDVSSSTTQCVAAGVPIELWRPIPTRRTTLLLTRLGNGERASAEWPAGAATLAWPSALPPADGETYAVQLTDNTVRSRFGLKFVPLAAGSSVEVAEKLASAGCQAQAQLLLETIADPTGRP